MPRVLNTLREMPTPPRSKAPPIALSFIVPMYNESKRVAASLREIAHYLDQQPYESEIVLVDDGSSDDTAAIVQEAAGAINLPVRLLRYSPNRGKGFALKVGFEAARGEVLVFSDCDLSTPVEELSRLLSALEDADIAIGTRKAPGAKLVRRQPRLRESLGVVFTLIVRVLIASVSDATCGFKGFNRAVGKELFSLQRIEDWSFDAELLFNARRRGHRVVEIPVRWEDRDGTKVKLPRDIVVTLMGIVKIRVYDFLGYYKKPLPVGDFSETDIGNRPGMAAEESRARQPQN